MHKILSNICFLGLFLFCSVTLQAQNNERPKLVVGIVVDQMRYDYLYRFYDLYSENGFKRLLNQGFSCENTHHNYAPTNTAPGHASIFTGSTPAYHGIIDNNWYERGKTEEMYCTQDLTVKSLGIDADNVAGKMSPFNLKTSTITDELRLASNQKSKVVGVSIKDRGAILPAGHLANAAYWYDYASGKMISSTYYFESLPTWVQNFNQQNYADGFIKEGWKLLLPQENYSLSLPDENNYEAEPKKGRKAVFPYLIDEFDTEKRYRQFAYTAHANTFLKNFAIEAIKNEELGKDTTTDFLTLSFSSTDLIGHRYGIHSVEVQDTYLRLDKDLEALFVFLDETIGTNEYVVFLTADHAGAPNPQHLHDLKVDAGYLVWDSLKTTLNQHLTTAFGEGQWVDYLTDQSVYLNQKLAKEKNIDFHQLQDKTVAFLTQYPHILQATPKHELAKGTQRTGLMHLIQNGFHHQLSPDVVFLFQSNFMDSYYKKGGTTHGTSFAYDTQVPLLFYGKAIPKGKTYRRVEITDIAATMAALLKLQQPSGCIGNPIVEIFE